MPNEKESIDNMQNKLEPCPLCGGKAVIAEAEFTFSTTRCKIVCINCGLTLDWTQHFATDEVIDPATGVIFDRKAVILSLSPFQAWNRRIDNATE